MAKSIRSKWKRKCRAVKRERYAVKELARLKKTLGISDEGTTSNGTQDIVMESTSSSTPAETEQQVIFLDAGQIKSKKNKIRAQVAKEESEAEMSSDDERVTVEEDGKKRVFSSKTLMDQNGQYPKWLHKRKIAKLANKGKKNIKKKRAKRRKH